MFERLDQPFDLNLDQYSAEFFPQALDEPALVRLETALAALPIDTPGVRIGQGLLLTPLLEIAGPIGAIAAAAIGPGALPVRAILFDKTAARNWRSAGIRTARSSSGSGSCT